MYLAECATIKKFGRWQIDLMERFRKLKFKCWNLNLNLKFKKIKLLVKTSARFKQNFRFIYKIKGSLDRNVYLIHDEMPSYEFKCQ